jgi:hypothetical protein
MASKLLTDSLTKSLRGYPEVSLKHARENRDELKKILQSGKDPSIFRKQASKEKIQALAGEVLTQA